MDQSRKLKVDAEDAGEGEMERKIRDANIFRTRGNIRMAKEK